MKVFDYDTPLQERVNLSCSAHFEYITLVLLSRFLAKKIQKECLNKIISTTYEFGNTYLSCEKKNSNPEIRTFKTDLYDKEICFFLKNDELNYIIHNFDLKEQNDVYNKADSFEYRGLYIFNISLSNTAFVKLDCSEGKIVSKNKDKINYTRVVNLSNALNFKNIILFYEQKLFKNKLLSSLGIEERE